MALATFFGEEASRQVLIEQVKNLAQKETLLLSINDLSLNHQTQANLEIVVFGISSAYLNENIYIPGLLGRKGVLKPIDRQIGVSFLTEKLT